MADNPEYHLERELAEQLGRWETAVLRGDAADWADYKYLCGQICGIRFAMQVLADMRQQIAASEDGGFA